MELWLACRVLSFHHHTWLLAPAESLGIQWDLPLVAAGTGLYVSTRESQLAQMDGGGVVGAGNASRRRNS